mgnify:FL=1|jgi:carbon monoxide dehydrogenase subunit G|tara:strand:- start:1155 stop:1391 length:237 start_codon:yes stop_codon:yes gene_type:complete
MTSVNVTETKNTVTVSGEGAATVVTVTTAGPQGASGLGTTVDDTAKVDKSVVYYDSASGKFKADDTWTINTIVLGGNF